MSESHKSTPVPSPLLAVVALGIVHRLRPSWIAIDVGAAARGEGLNPERISRIVSRALGLFEAALSTLTRRGRPPRHEEVDERDAELARTRELLAVASAVLATISKHKASAREMIVGAWRRLSATPTMTQARFCAAVGVSARTLRSWLKAPPRTPASPVLPPAPKPPRRRPPRRRRFEFDVTLPATQVGADTTDLSAFGVSLKLVAAQDIGGRDASLFDAIVVDDHESAEHVERVLTEVLRGTSPGVQTITDQGTPYMAERTKAALERFGAEHAPQREGDPCGKSTVERAFRSIKDIARPLLTLTDHLAEALPALRDGALAKAAATLVLTALLRAYQHGARAARTATLARGSVDPQTLAELAERTRERARADEHSARLLLAHVHEIYGLAGAARSFVNAFRRYPVAVLRDAERAMRAQVHRDDIRDRRSYFGAIVRKLDDEHTSWRTSERRRREQDARRAREHREHSARLAAWHADPPRCLRDALDLIAMQWLPEVRALFADGVGYGLGLAQRALATLVDVHGAAAAADVTRGVLACWRVTSLDRLGHDAIDAVQRLVLRELDRATLRATARCAADQTSATLSLAGHFSRPPPSNRLRN